MNYYFNIAGIKVLVESELEIRWNKYIREFICEKFDKPDEHYRCVLVDALEPSGRKVYETETFVALKNGELEQRLYYIVGYDEPYMLYDEKADSTKYIYLNKKFMEAFTSEDNYCIFNALAFEKVLINHEAIVLHCSYIVDEGEAILFTAPSGTGKSTQADLWKKYKNATIVNGDRAIIKKIDGQYYALGMPICGSSDICLDVKSRIKCIVYLSQYKTNEIYELRAMERAKRLFSETTVNFFNNSYADKAFNIVADLAVSVDMCHLACTKYEEAVDTLYERLEGKK